MKVNEQTKIEDAAQLITSARHLVVFSGAGLSTPSGIPDFRSQKTGLWQKNNPMEVASATAFKYQPERFYNWLRPLLQAASKAEPNPAHSALAQLEEMGIIRAIITQNIDGLHQKAGSSNVIELHGTMNKMGCPKCHYSLNDNSQSIQEILNGGMPHCEKCGTILKPGITLFEESLPMNAWQQAELEIQIADVMLIVGSSLEVVPASSLPYEANRNGCKLIIVNLSPTFMDEKAEITLSMDVAVGIPLLLKKVIDLRALDR